MKRIEADLLRGSSRGPVDESYATPVPLRSAAPTKAVWERLLAARRTGAAERSAAWSDAENAAFDLYDALLERDGSHVLAQIGQSLDGRVTTGNGDAMVVSGHEGLKHLHRCRALVDAVIIGVTTALTDDPQLTVRLVDGDSPARVVIDPNGRLPDDANLLRDDGCRRLVVQSSARSRPPGVETIELACGKDGRVDPTAVLAALRERGLPRVLVEGGGVTIGRFLEAGAVDRLHVAISPLIIGAGAPGLTLPPVARLADAIRPATRVYGLGTDIVFDCDMATAPGRASRST